MSLTRNDEKPRLRDERYQVQVAQAGWIPVIAITSAAAGVIDPHLIAVPPALASVFVYSLKRQESAIENILDDPPRDDFATRTQAHSRRYITGRLGDSELASVTDTTVAATLKVTAYLEAAVRADERAQGAERAGSPHFAQARAREALIFRERARAADADRAVWLDALSIAWARWAADPEVQAAGDLYLDEEAFYRSIAEAVRATGLVVSDLPRPEIAASADSVTATVIVAAQKSRELARSGEAFFADARTSLAEQFVIRSLEVPVRSFPHEGGRSTDELFELGSSAALRGNTAEAVDLLGEAMRITRSELPSRTKMVELDFDPALKLENRSWLGPPPGELGTGESD